MSGEDFGELGVHGVGQRRVRVTAVGRLEPVLDVVQEQERSGTLEFL